MVSADENGSVADFLWPKFPQLAFRNRNLESCATQSPGAWSLTRVLTMTAVVIPSEVEEPRDRTDGSATESFDSATLCSG